MDDLELIELRLEVVRLRSQYMDELEKGARLLLEIAGLREALKFYAAPATWDYPAHHYEDAHSYNDEGKIAREALMKELTDA